MKRILAIVFSFFVLVNIVGAIPLVNASDMSENIENFVNYDALVIGNVEVNSNFADSDSVKSLDSPSLCVVFEKRNFEIGELVSVQFELAEFIVGVDVMYESDGFSVAGAISNDIDIETGCQTYNVLLNHDGVSINPYFEFCVITDDDKTVCAKVYGYLSDHGLFVSDSSFDAAKNCSLYNLVEAGVLSMDEYNEVLQQEYRQLGIENSDKVLPMNTMSSSVVSIMNITAKTTVTGTLGWEDDAGVWHPLQYNKVEIWDDRYNEKLGTVYTDVFGDYSFAFTDVSSYRDIYVIIYPAGENSEVLDGHGGVYCYSSEKQINVAPGSSIDIDWIIDMTSNLGRAFQISQAINVACQYVKQMNGAYITPVTVKYPHVNANNSNCYYQNNAIHIKDIDPEPGCPKTYAAWDVIMHEYGHHVQVEFDITDSPGGNHAITANLTERYSKDTAVRLAWGESYPSIFGEMAQIYYASSLQNIATVGDEQYVSYGGILPSYETLSYQKGEACEASIMGVLWDLYDGANELHDTISLSHSEYWNMITNSGAGSLSDFCNYFIDRYYEDKELALGRLLSYYKMSPSNLIADLTGETPAFSWTANGTSSTLQNNRFDLVFFDARNIEITRVENIAATSYTVSEDVWGTIMLGYGLTYTTVVVGYQDSSPATGGYFSAPLQIAKPIENQSSSIVQYSPGNMRYFERTMTITPGTYYDLYVTFKNAGTKLIQTFSNEYTALELYSATGDLLVSRADTIDKGYGNNAFFSFDVAAETQYIIRVKMWDSHASGTVKVAMIPAKGECASGSTSIQRFEDIITFEDYIFHTSSLEYNYANVLVFKPLETGEYAFEISSNMDTVISVIDPRSPNALIYNVDYANDGGMGQNAVLTKTLEANVPYVVVYSGYDIWDTNNTGGLLLNAYLV